MSVSVRPVFIHTSWKTINCWNIHSNVHLINSGNETSSTRFSILFSYFTFPPLNHEETLVTHADIHEEIYRLLRKSCRPQNFRGAADARSVTFNIYLTVSQRHDAKRLRSGVCKGRKRRKRQWTGGNAEVGGEGDDYEGEARGEGGSFPLSFARTKQDDRAVEMAGRGGRVTEGCDKRVTSWWQETQRRKEKLI